MLFQDYLQKQQRLDLYSFIVVYLNKLISFQENSNKMVSGTCTPPIKLSDALLVFKHVLKGKEDPCNKR